MKLKTSILFFLLIAGAVCSHAAVQERHHIYGTVLAAGKALSHAKIQLFKARSESPCLLETCRANCQGEYQICFQANECSQLYLLASDPHHPEIVLGAAFIPCDTSNRIIINELSTVATVYALAQFIEQNDIFGPLPGIRNATSTIRNLVSLCHGKPGKVISNFQNGAHDNIRSTRALKTQNTLANLISACASDPESCKTLLSLVSSVGNPADNTFQAIHSIARNPFVQDNEALFHLAESKRVFRPALEVAPQAWTIALHFVKGGFSAPGRMAFDSCGNLWSNNNFMPPAGSLPNEPGRQITVLNPLGKPILGSPIFSQFVYGSGYGTAVDQKDRTWISSFADGQIAQFNPCGEVVQHSGDLNHPMGIALDQKGNLWIANMGDPSDPLDFGSISVYLGGNPENRIDHAPGIHKPFSVAIDAQGLCWVANSGFIPVGSVTILELTADNQINVVQNQLTSKALNAPIEPGSLRPYGNFASPKTIAIDRNGNGWVNNLEISELSFIDGKTFKVTDYPVDPRSRGWGLAVDGNGFIWAASFSNPPFSPIFQKPPVISVVEGTGMNLGQFLYSFSNPALQHLTALQIDSSGNVWVANNWSLETTPEQVIGGDGVVQFIGLAAPVATPLIGPPAVPAHQRAVIE